MPDGERQVSRRVGVARADRSQVGVEDHDAAKPEEQANQQLAPAQHESLGVPTPLAGLFHSSLASNGSFDAFVEKHALTVLLPFRRSRQTVMRILSPRSE